MAMMSQYGHGRSRKFTEITESVTKKRYVMGDSQYAFHAGKLIQVTTPGLLPSVGLKILKNLFNKIMNLKI